MSDKKSAQMFAMGARDSSTAVYKHMNGHIKVLRAIFEQAARAPEQELLTNEDVVKLLKTLEKSIENDAILAKTLYTVEIDTLNGNNPYEGSA